MCHEQWALTVIKLLRFFVLIFCQDCDVFYAHLRICKSAYYEPVPKPGNSDSCGRKGIRHEDTLGCMAGFTLTPVCVVAVTLLMVVQ